MRAWEDTTEVLWWNFKCTQGQWNHSDAVVWVFILQDNLLQGRIAFAGIVLMLEHISYGWMNLVI